MDHPVFMSPQQAPEFMKPLTGGKFRFACHPGVACFTNCCADLNLVLTPYDVLRLKTALRVSSGQFLERYTTDDIPYNSGLPAVGLKMGNDPKRKCPFLSPAGCAAYADRPGACRLYPVGRAARYAGNTLQEEYFLVKESHCLGFGEAREWTVQEWLADQGLEAYDEMNALWMGVNRGVAGGPSLSPVAGDKLKMYFMACYNLDQFRRFVFESRLLQIFRIDDDTLTQIRASQMELLKFAFAWVEFSVFGKKTMQVKQSVLKAKGGAHGRR